MDDKMMSKPVLVRRELGQGCAVVRVVECAQGALFGRFLGAQWALRGRSSAQRPRFPGRFDGRSE